MNEIKVLYIHSALSFLHLVLSCFIAQNSTYSNPACEHEGETGRLVFKELKTEMLASYSSGKHASEMYTPLYPTFV